VSLANELVTRIVLPLRGGKRRHSDVGRTRRHIVERAWRPASFAPPRRLARRADVSLRRHDGWPVYELAPRSAAPVRHVLYLHGGSYVNEIVRSHWSFVGHLVATAPVAAVVPIYPLGASVGAAGTVAGATAIAAELVERAGPDGVVLMGDSAGGGLTLAVAQALRDHGLTAHRVVLISPWLDVATALPEQREIEPRDAMLAIPGLVECGRTYAAGLPLDDPRVSPIHGEMSGLPPLTVFSGTHDLVNPDSRRLCDACAAAGVPCDLVEAPGMPHVYPLMPTPEGRAARRQIVQLVRG
jgi:epsilon-lactone hydrolase